MDPMPAIDKHAELRRGWSALFGGVLGMGAGLGMFGQVMGFFVKPLQADFGWGRGLIAMSSGAVMLTSLTMPLVGVLVDRWGPRRFVGLGCLAFAACYATLSIMPGAPWAYLTIMAAIGLLAGPATAPLVFVRPIVEVFYQFRGLALAICMSGAALLSLVVLPLLAQMVSGQGWRAGFGLMALISLGCGFTSYLLLSLNAARRRDAGAVAGEQAAETPGATFSEACADRRFWLIALAMAAANTAGGAFGSQLQPLLSDKGLSLTTAALMGSLYAGMVLVGRVLVGVLLDRFWAPAVAALALSGPMLGLLIFIPEQSDIWPVMLGISLVALAQGAEGDILAFFTAKFWGLKSFGVIFGVLGMVLGVSVAAGGMLAGFAFDLFGDYRAVLLVGSALSVIAAGSILATGLGVKMDQTASRLARRALP